MRTLRKQDSTIKVGLIGCGKHCSTTHVPALLTMEHVELVALSECVYPNELSQRQRQFRIPNAFMSYMDMLRSIELDAVVISTPHTVHYEQTNKDTFKEWELNAQSAQYFKNENKIVLQSIALTFYSDEGKRYNLTAEQGELYTDSNDLKVFGNVFVDTDEGYQVRTDSFHYNAAERTIFTDAKVTLKSKELVMTGTGMVVDLEEERLRILRDVRALENK